MIYPKDHRVKTTQDGDTLTITYRLGKKIYAIGALLLFSFPFLPLLSVGSVTRSGEVQTLQSMVGTGLFFALFFWPFGYLILVFALNFVTVRAAKSKLEIVNGPLPFCRTREYEAEEIIQFFVCDVRTNSNHIDSVKLVDTEHIVRPVTDNHPSKFAALDICHSLQQFYGLEKREIYGITTHQKPPGIDNTKVERM